MKSILRQQVKTRQTPDRGMGLLEPLLLTFMLMMAVAAMASVFNSISRSMVATQQQVLMQASIDTSLRQIRALARQYTCCSGYCTTTPPSCTGDNCGPQKPPTSYNYGIANGILQACATNDPRADRYYFPQTTLSNNSTTIFPNTTTALVPLAVEQLCNSTNNTVFMSRLLTEVNNSQLITPRYATLKAEISQEQVHVLVVTFTSTINGSKVVRIENIIPKMANFCP